MLRLTVVVFESCCELRAVMNTGTSVDDYSERNFQLKELENFAKQSTKHDERGSFLMKIVLSFTQGGRKFFVIYTGYSSSNVR